MIMREAVNPPAGVTRDNFYRYCTRVDDNLHSVNARTIAASEFKNRVFIESCWDFADYQRKFCQGNSLTLHNEGFQVGSPWHGDILNAPVLFLSINPAITPRCFFPRWHPSADGIQDRFTLAGLDGAGNSVYTLTDISGNGIANDITGNCDKEIYNFLTNRFQDTCTRPDTGNLDAIVVDGNNTCQPRGREVRYWSGMKRVMEELIGNPGCFAPADHTKRLMRSVLSSEVIFWGTQSQDDAGNDNDETLNKRLDYFWEKFAVPLLKNCGAKILFLVGANSTREVFNRALCVKNGELFSQYRNRYGEEFRVAAINNLSQPPYNYTNIVKSLKDEARKPGIVRDAIAESIMQYHR